ncbi:APC family permease [Actinobaculum sp. 352]|uniref:APC family permease n=1 Tax=Actinobaculum sp. 352 TaxID=2490946 RepID=UPI000F7D7082|nr:APC family permease [Actinobaculum sp. 352]RTE48725.1 APC family permease [Actinobaculum sp. 352]
MMVTDKHYRLARLTRNAPVFAAVVVTTIIVPQIILRAASTGSGRTEIVVSALVGAAGLAVAFLTDIWIYRLAPRRAIHQLASVYLGGGAAIVVASARFVCHTLFVVLGAGLAVSGGGALVDFSAQQRLVLVATILVLALPVLFGRTVNKSLLVAGALAGAIALGVTLLVGMVVEATGGIDAAQAIVARRDALSTGYTTGHLHPLLEACLGATFPACLLILTSERVSERPEERRVNPRSLGWLFAVFTAGPILVTMYFVVALHMPGRRLGVPSLSMALAFLGTTGQRIVAVCYIITGVVAVLGAYMQLPRLLRELAIDHVLPRKLAAADAVSPRLAIVGAAAVLAAGLSSFLTTTQAGAMVFIFAALVIAAIGALAMSARGASILKESMDRQTRNAARASRLVFFLLFLVCMAGVVAIAVADLKWLVAGVVALAVPASILVFFRRGRVRIVARLTPTDITAGRSLPTRVHGVILIGALDRASLRAVAFARALRPTTLTALTVDYDPQATRALQRDWAAASLPVSLTVLGQPQGAAVSPIVDYIRAQRALHPADIVVVYIPRIVSTGLWRRFFLSHSTPQVIKDLRLECGVVIAEVPFQLVEDDADGEELE